MFLSPKQTKERLGKRIQKARKNAGLTQEELAEKVNISRTHMGHIEQGRKTPSIKVVTKISKAVRVKISELF